MNSNKKMDVRFWTPTRKQTVSEHSIQYKKCIKELNDRMAMCF